MISRRIVFRLLAASLFCLCSSFPAWADDGELGPDSPNEFNIMHENILRLAQENFQQSVSAEQAELEQPQSIISKEDGAIAIRIGTRSAIAEWCEVEWNESHFLKFMDHARKTGHWNEQQLAFLSVVHQLTMGIIGRQLKQDGTCPETERERIQTFLKDWSPEEIGPHKG